MIRLRSSVTVAVALVGFSAQVQATGAAETKQFATEFGKTLPPICYVKFCASNPAECKKHNVTTGKVELSSDAWRNFYQVNASVNEQTKPVSDQELVARQNSGPSRQPLATVRTSCFSRSAISKPWAIRHPTC
jgi:predicted transglutaminase-like cysteine proteinase